MYVGVPEDKFLLDPHLPPIGTVLRAEECYALAYRAALAGLGHVSPNPLVGCVITAKQGRLLAHGAHRSYGGQHAEVDALQQAQAQGGADCLRGARLYVTLQPCTHQGKTPPCSTLLVRHGVGEVHYGAIDPNPQVGSLAALEQAGIVCHRYEYRELQWLDEAYFFHATGKHQRPFVAAKIATTLDGKFAWPPTRGKAAVCNDRSSSSDISDTRMLVSGKRALQYGHFLRQRYDAILVGAGTLRYDNPRLNVRVPLPRRRTPRRVVLANTELLRTDMRVIEDEPHTVIVVVTDTEAQRSRALLPSAVQLLPLPRQSDGKFCVLQLLQELYRQHSIYSLLLEGGGQLWASFFNTGLVDKLHLFQSPTLQPQARDWQAELKDMQASVLRNVRLLPLDRDWVIEGLVR